MLSTDHPIFDIQVMLISDHPKLVFEFSKYVSGGYGKTLSREIFKVNAKDISEDWLTSQESSLMPGEELAIHSRVELKGKAFHIPMIDFIHTKRIQDIHQSSMTVKGKICSPYNFIFYDSGRSIHGYCHHLIEESAWVKYLGGLLLCNFTQENKREIIDTRWVGHSLEHGFCALRWSCNTHQYESRPSRLQEILSGGSIGVINYFL